MNHASGEAGVGEPERGDAVREARLLGLAVGLSVGPAGGFVQAWSGNADGRVHVWLLMTALGGLVGAASLPIFRPPGARASFGLGFLMLFGFAVALVAGTFAAFPVGASLGTAGGAVGGLAAGLVWRVRALEGRRLRTWLAALVAMLAAWLVVFAWTL